MGEPCPAPLRVAMRSPLPFPCVPDRPYKILLVQVGTLSFSHPSFWFVCFLSSSRLDDPSTTKEPTLYIAMKYSDLAISLVSPQGLPTASNSRRRAGSLGYGTGPPASDSEIRLGDWQTFQKFGAAGARCVPTMVGRAAKKILRSRQPFLIGKWPLLGAIPLVGAQRSSQAGPAAFPSTYTFRMEAQTQRRARLRDASAAGSTSTLRDAFTLQEAGHTCP